MLESAEAEGGRLSEATVIVQALARFVAQKLRRFSIWRRNAGDMAHLPARPNVHLSIEVQMLAGFGKDVEPAIRVFADQIAHFDCAEPHCRAERPADDRSNVLLELRRQGAV